MKLKKLEQSGSGIVLKIGKNELLKFAPRAYSAHWKALLHGRGKYAVVLGAGTAEREVFFGLEGACLNENNFPEIHCFDLAVKAPELFRRWSQKFPNLEIKYFGKTDIRNWKPDIKYFGNTRLVSVHGVLDYLPKVGIVRLIKQIVEIRPGCISIRLMPMNEFWHRKFASKRQLKRERDSVERVRQGRIGQASESELIKTGVVNLEIPLGEKRLRNLADDYPSTHVIPDMLAGYFLGQGYALKVFEKYEIEKGKTDPDGIMLFFERRDSNT